MFRLAKSKATTGTEATEKVLSVVYNEESIRQRKKRVRGSEAYSQQSTVLSYTQGACVPDTVPEKRRPHYTGHNTGDVIGWVDCLPSDSLWTVTRWGRRRRAAGLILV